MPYISQGSVAPHLRCGGVIIDDSITNLLIFMVKHPLRKNLLPDPTSSLYAIEWWCMGWVSVDGTYAVFSWHLKKKRDVGCVAYVTSLLPPSVDRNESIWPISCLQWVSSGLSCLEIFAHETEYPLSRGFKKFFIERIPKTTINVCWFAFTSFLLCFCFFVACPEISWKTLTEGYTESF